MIMCYQCMTMVHPECCGALDEVGHIGPYSCSMCRQMCKRMANLESQMENMYSLNKDLIHLLTKSQNECENLRGILEKIRENMNLKPDPKVSVGVQTGCGTSPETNQLVNDVDQNAPLSENPTLSESKDDENLGSTIRPNGEATQKSSKDRIKPVPKPRLKKQPKRVTVLGKSMVRNVGKSLKKNLENHETCVYSQSGLGLEQGAKMIPKITHDYTEQDATVVHLGTTDIEQSGQLDVESKFGYLIERTKKASPKTNIIVTSIAKRVHRDAGLINKKVDNVNKALQDMCELDKQCVYMDCNPPLHKSYYKKDGKHFSFAGTEYFSDILYRSLISANFPQMEYRNSL